jgi:putative transposase
MRKRSWPEFVPFLDFPLPIRKLIYTNNGTESLNARFRQAVRRHGLFPTEQAAVRILYLTVRERRPNRNNPTGTILSWKNVLNTLAITYGDRLNIKPAVTLTENPHRPLRSAGCSQLHRDQTVPL